MTRVFLSLLLSVNLLACPLRCVTCSASEVVHESSSPAACGCCHQECEVPAAPAPVDGPDDECACQDCICEGATLSDAPKIPDRTILNHAAPEFTPGDVETRVFLVAHQLDSHGIWAGRDRRIAHQSLLI